MRDSVNEPLLAGRLLLSFFSVDLALMWRFSTSSAPGTRSISTDFVFNLSNARA
jgi:hypothetical protein